MPFNLTQGSTAEIIARFYDALGTVTVPSCATLTTTYTSVTGTSESSAVGMTRSSQSFVALWGSVPASLGIATIAVSAPGQSVVRTDTIRVTSTVVPLVAASSGGP